MVAREDPIQKTMDYFNKISNSNITAHGLYMISHELELKYVKDYANMTVEECKTCCANCPFNNICNNYSIELDEICDVYETYTYLTFDEDC